MTDMKWRNVMRYDVVDVVDVVDVT